MRTRTMPRPRSATTQETTHQRSLNMDTERQIPRLEAHRTLQQVQKILHDNPKSRYFSLTRLSKNTPFFDSFFDNHLFPCTPHLFFVTLR